MTAAPDPTTNVAVELAQLRGEINTGLENIKGTLGILVERTTRTDADVRRCAPTWKRSSRRSVRSS